MMRTARTIVLAIGLTSSGTVAGEELRPNTWTRVNIDWKRVLAHHVDDGRWSTTDGYSDSIFRTKSGEVLIRTGIASKVLGTSPGFYSNTTVAWKVADDEARVVEIAHWGGGSYGHGKLLPSFAEHETPTPRHTYDGICYVPNEDAMYLMLGANWRVGGRGAEENAKRQLETDNQSTWKYEFPSKRWTRIGHNIRKFWPSQHKVSPYESHLTHWPAGGKLLFLNDRGDCYAEFDSTTRQWANVSLRNKCPMSLYNARSTWDSKRSLWVFRLGPQLCTFDPQTKGFAKLPECWDLPRSVSREEKKKEPRWASKGVCYIPKHDVYLVTGPTGNDTRVYEVNKGTWVDVKGGDLELVNGYCHYDPASDLVVMNYQLDCFKLHYAPRSQPAGDGASGDSNSRRENQNGLLADLPLGALSHDGPATPEQISMYLPVTAALDFAARASVRYRRDSGDDWVIAHPLHRIRPADTAGEPPADAFAGVITGLTPGMEYTAEVAVKLGESVATRTFSAMTRRLPIAGGEATKTIPAGSTKAQIKAAFSKAKPGEVIQFENGTYVVDGLQLQCSGTEEKPICIRGESRAGVVLKDTSGTILQILEAKDVIVENLTFEGSKSDSGTKAGSRGVSFWNGAPPQERITLRKLTFVGVDMGIVAWGDTKQLLVYDNTLCGNNKWEESSLKSNQTWNDDGIRVPGLGNAVFNNTLTGFGDSLAMSARCTNVGVHFYRNEIRMTGDDAYEGDYGVRNVTFYDNRVHNSMTLISYDPIYGGPAFGFRNIAINVGRGPYKLNNKNTGFFLYNNTVVRTEGYASGGKWGWAQFANGPLVAWAYCNNILIFRGKGNLMAMESRGQNPIDFTNNAWYPDRSVWWTKSGGSFKSMAEARAKLRATKPLFGKSARRHEGGVICEMDPFVEKIELGESFLKQITIPCVPRLADGAAPRGGGVAIPGITDGFSGKAPDMGAIITGLPVPVWGDRSAR